MVNGSAGKAPAKTTATMAYAENFMLIAVVCCIPSFQVGHKIKI